VVLSARHPLVFEESFASGSIERARITFGAAGGRLNLELYFKARSIAPGAAEVFATTWKFLPSADV